MREFGGEFAIESRQNKAAVVLTFNPAARVDVVPFDDRHFCLVIDDALTDAEAVVQFALGRRAEFKPVDFNFYPVTYLMGTAAMTARLGEYFQFHARRHFDARRSVHTNCRFSVVTRPPALLHPFQWLCHRDDPGLPPELSMQASVLYLFDNPVLGGTAFYAPVRPAEELGAMFADAGALAPAEFAAKHGLKPGYMDGANDWFRRLGSIEAKWNRLIIYDGSMFHTGDIRAPERLSDDPGAGRLTLNGFFTNRRHVVGARR